MNTKNTTMTKASPRRKPQLIDLALQGGGSHGAFTWGVLDRLLQESWLEIDAISGTSAGAMNAAVMTSGYAKGGAEGARAALEGFWKSVSDAAKSSPFRRGPLEMLTGKWTLEYSPMFLAAELASRVFSPYDLAPSGFNPMRELLAEAVDFKSIAKSPIKLFITATNVHTGSGHVFRNADITPDVLLASGCLPMMFQAVEINGEFYWDGGYAGNPTMTPLVRECQSNDTILVQINPIKRDTVPTTARDILDRLNEVSFNAPLLKELRMIALLHKVADPGTGEGAQWAQMRMHRIASDTMLGLSATSKMISEWEFLCELRDLGRTAADAFLNAHADDLGKKSTLDLDALLENC